MYLRNLKANRKHKEEIKEINESKEIDAIEKELDRNEEYLRGEFYERKQEINQQFYSIEDSEKTQRIQEPYKKYSTNDQTHAKTMYKIWDYNSGIQNSTQAASPYYKFSTQSKFKQDANSETEQNSVKKKLFHEENSEQKSPEFDLRESKYDTLAFTFKKKIDQYPRLFSERDSPQTERKIKFSKVQFLFEPHTENSKENDSLKLNFNLDTETPSSIKKKLNFETVPLKEENNPILKQINQEIKRDQQILEQSETDYKISRKNQTDLIKRKIIESKSDLKRFYEVDSQNVQYEYRKAKFMDIFLGSRTLQHNLR